MVEREEEVGVAVVEVQVDVDVERLLAADELHLPNELPMTRAAQSSSSYDGSIAMTFNVSKHLSSRSSYLH